ncbi:hypothetical protein L9F63_009659 [Diploptera punctata]|uniref:Zinc-finger domain-containing protein n=1 Tax=Diploptera punctata TaxID=6984 RepID=A0AAD8ESF2_DIPPU|nr:hypothetical protein L9F63_009659 [Diploptera punctata]
MNYLYLLQFSTLLKELRELSEPLKKTVTSSPPRLSAPRQRTSYSNVIPNTRIRRSRRIRHSVKLKRQEDEDYILDSDEDDESDGSEDDRIYDPKKLIIVCFPCQTKFRIVDHSNDPVQEESSDEEDIFKQPQRRIVRRVAEDAVVLSPDEVTEKDIKNVAQKSGGKTYSKEYGTSCHQCRQKTLDTKTMCRSGSCIGVRGQFCGPCLKNRYGESAEKALKDPNWACPPCRGLCNCSICRTREGKRPTGILVPLVKSEGYSSVKEYLEFQET